MMIGILHRGAAALSLLALATPAFAGSSVLMQPTPVGSETIRFAKGVPTLDLEKEHGAVQVTPLPMDHGSFAFAVAVLNRGAQPANIDVTNFDVQLAGQKYAVFTRDQLESKAKNRAMWASIALAAAGGLAAAAAANQREHYHATTYTPHGVYHTDISAPSAAGQAAAAASIAGAGVGIAAIQSRLDQTRAMLGDTTIQMTTVDPGDSYGGRVVIAKMKTDNLPARVSFVVNWNGEQYPFAFQIAKKGTPQPVFAAITPPPPPPPVESPVAQPAVVAPTSPAAPVLTPAVAVTKS